MDHKLIDLIEFRARRQQDRARKLSQQPKSIKESIGLYQDLIREHPTEPANYFHLAQLFFQEKQHESALSVLQHARRACGASVPLFTRLVEIHEAIGDLPRLKQVIRRFCRHFPEEYLPLFKLAEIHFRENEFRRSLACLKKVLRLQVKNNEEVFFLVAQNLRQAGKFRRAIPWYRRARQVGVADPVYDFNIGLCLKELRRFDEALGHFRRGLRIPGVNPIFFHFQMGAVFYEQEKFDLALRCFKKALDFAPRDESTLYFIGLCHGRLQNHREALNNYERLREINPEYFNIYNNIGNSHYFLKDYPNAIAAFLKALELEPNSERAHNNIGNLYCELGDFEQGLRYLKRSFEINPHYLMPISNLANAYKARKDFPTAEHYCRLLLKEGEENALAYFNLAYVQYMQKKWTEARENLEKAMERDPSNADALQLLGAVHFALEDLEKSEECYKRALALLPQQFDFQFNLAMVYLRRSNFAGAIEILSQLLRVFPNDHGLRRFLGLAYFHSGQDQPARDCLLRCVSEFESDANFLETLCSLDLKTGHLAEARIHFEAWRRVEGWNFRQIRFYAELTWKSFSPGGAPKSE